MEQGEFLTLGIILIIMSSIYPLTHKVLEKKGKEWQKKYLPEGFGWNEETYEVWRMIARALSVVVLIVGAYLILKGLKIF